MKSKRILKWLLGLFLVGLLVLVILFLSLDTIFRSMVVHSLKAQTGMEAEIGHFHLGLFEPVISIQDLKLRNPPGFGGTPLLDIPEIYVEYDRPALKTKHELHITVLRFNLGELDIVKNEAGQTNLMALGLTIPSKDDLTKSKDLDEIKKRTGIEFKGIDLLTVSVGKAKYIDLGDPKKNREQNIDLEKVPIPNVKSLADLAGLVVLIALKSDNFFTPLMAPVNLK